MRLRLLPLFLRRQLGHLAQRRVDAALPAAAGAAEMRDDVAVEPHADGVFGNVCLRSSTPDRLAADVPDAAGEILAGELGDLFVVLRPEHVGINFLHVAPDPPGALGRTAFFHGHWSASSK